MEESNSIFSVTPDPKILQRLIDISVAQPVLPPAFETGSFQVVSEPDHHTGDHHQVTQAPSHPVHQSASGTSPRVSKKVTIGNNKTTGETIRNNKASEMMACDKSMGKLASSSAQDISIPIPNMIRKCGSTRDLSSSAPQQQTLRDIMGPNRTHHVSAQDVTMVTKISSYDEVPPPNQHRGSIQSEHILHQSDECTKVEDDQGCDTFSLNSSIYSGMGKHSATISRNLNNYASTLPKGPVQKQLNKSLTSLRTGMGGNDETIYEKIDRNDVSKNTKDNNICTTLNLPPPLPPPSAIYLSAPTWCSCRRCCDGDTGFVCCLSLPELIFLSNGSQCVTKSTLFCEVVLNKAGLRLSDWLGKKTLSSSTVQKNNTYRHLAYNSFVQLVSSNVRKQWTEKVLPSCVVTAIRQIYPSANNRYNGPVRSK
eukprot:sb/3464990/